MDPLANTANSSSGEEDIRPPGRASRLKTQTPAIDLTEDLQNGESGSAGPSPSRLGVKSRVISRRSRGGNLSFRTESRSLHTQPGTSTSLTDETTSDSPSSRPGRPSGPLTPGHFGNRRASNRSSSSTSGDDIPMISTRKPHSFMPEYPHSHQFPSFKGCARLNGFSKPSEKQTFFDCKFYPYTAPGVDPVFAFVGGAEIGIARPSTNSEEGIQMISWFHEEEAPPLQSSDYDYDDDDDEPITTPSRRGGKPAQKPFRKPDPIDLNSCAWLQDPISKAPLLAVSGKPSTIKVLDIAARKLVRTFIGHGKEVNDLAVSPLDSSILASASGDHTVRIWTLLPEHSHQPCMLLCAGEGHKQSILTLAFHQSGRYLLTGGVDNAICLWVIPSLPNELSGTYKPTMLHFPHFRSASIHTSFVDCVAFHNDLVISKCARENRIVIWRIEGFDSRREPPATPPTTAEDHSTISAWGGRFQRLTQLEASDTNAFYIRFSLFSFPGERPLLAIGNERSRVFFWDLKSLEEWVRPTSAGGAGAATEDSQTSTPQWQRGGRGGRSRKRGGRARGGILHSNRDASVTSETSNTRSDSVQTAGVGGGRPGGGGMVLTAMTPNKAQMDDPFKVLENHRVITVHKVNFACRQVAWSVGGEWMVVVGDQGMIAVFRRERPE